MTESRTTPELERAVKDFVLSAEVPERMTPRESNALSAGRVGLDTLMNLAGLNAFTADQEAMDRRVSDVLAGD